MDSDSSSLLKCLCEREKKIGQRGYRLDDLVHGISEHKAGLRGLTGGAAGQKRRDESFIHANSLKVARQCNVCARA